MKIASWVIVKNDTGESIFETFNKSTADAINTEKYRAVPIIEYLCSLNQKIKESAS